MSGGIYAIEHLASGRLYVGSTVHFRHRWNHHKMELRRGNHANQHLQRAWVKYGEIAFRFIPLETTGNEIRAREQWWLDYLMPFGQRGFNVCRSAGTVYGTKRTEETKRRMSIAQRARDWPPSAETLEKNRQAHLGLKHTDATRAKMSASRKGKPLGPKTPAAIAALRASFTPEVRAKISAAQIARNSMAKLSHEDVGAIRDLLKAGTTQRVIADRFGVNPATVSNIKTGKRRSLANI